ncbi:MAG: pyruvate kinase, partial [Pseudomonadota bacterium]
ARRLIGGRAALMSKIEKPSAVADIDRIVEMSDGCMVARGDLGVEIPAEDVPIAQVRIVQANRAAGKPVIVATQMLDSMVGSPTPTRAEAADVAKAVHDGADAVMLSAESAVGLYPIETVTMMARIVTRAERDDTAFRNLMTAGRPDPEPTGADAITHAAARVAETIGAAAIVAYSMTGSTVLRAARERPSAPILGLTPQQDVARRLTMSWGVRPMIGEDAHDFEDMVTTAVGAARTALGAPEDGKLVVIAGVPFGTPGATNILRIANMR